MKDIGKIKHRKSSEVEGKSGRVCGYRSTRILPWWSPRLLQISHPLELHRIYLTQTCLGISLLLSLYIHVIPSSFYSPHLLDSSTPFHPGEACIRERQRQKACYRRDGPSVPYDEKQSKGERCFQSLEYSRGEPWTSETHLHRAQPIFDLTKSIISL